MEGSAGAVAIFEAVGLASLNIFVILEILLLRPFFFGSTDCGASRGLSIPGFSMVHVQSLSMEALNLNALSRFRLNLDGGFCFLVSSFIVGLLLIVCLLYQPFYEQLVSGAILLVISAFLSPALAWNACRRLFSIWTCLFFMVLSTTVLADLLPRAVLKHVIQISTLITSGHYNVIFSRYGSEPYIDPLLTK